MEIKTILKTASGMLLEPGRDRASDQETPTEYPSEIYHLEWSSRSSQVIKLDRATSNLKIGISDQALVCVMS